LGAGFGATIPDFFYALDEPDEPGICIYLDGMAGHIHGNDAQAEKDRVIRARLESKDYTVVVVRSFDLDDKDTMVGAISKITKALVGKERARAVREDSAWFERARSESVPPRGRPALRLIRCGGEEPGAVPIYDLRVAAGAFSEGQTPAELGHGRVEGAAARRGLFVAQVVGDSMDKVAPKGAWCLWQHLGAPGVAAAAPGEDLVLRRPSGPDPELGEFTFKRLTETSRGRALVPVSTNPVHLPIPLHELEALEALARFVAVVSEDGG
jgi:hypothetical protein